MENRKGGRPHIGNIVSVALGDVLPRVDTYRAEHGLTRAAAIRTLITLGLENPMINAQTPTVTADHIRELDDAQRALSASATDRTDLRYMALADTGDGEVSTVVAATADDRGWDVLYTADDLLAWLDGTELTDSDAAVVAAEVNDELSRKR